MILFFRKKWKTLNSCELTATNLHGKLKLKSDSYPVYVTVPEYLTGTIVYTRLTILSENNFSKCYFSTLLVHMLYSLKLAASCYR